MRYLIGFFVLAVAGAEVLIGCNPVKFSEKKSVPCPLNKPCLLGNGLMRVTQTVTFNSTNKVDILMIVDNSGSMAVEQQNLSAPFNNFISNLNTNYPQLEGGRLDWQIGVTNTDVCGSGPFCPGSTEGARGRFMNRLGSTPRYGDFVISSGQPMADQTFAATVQRGTEVGSGDERGVYAADEAIDQNPAFFRDNSNLAVVILSDEDERSVGGRDELKSDPAFVALEDRDQPQTFLNKVSMKWNGTKSILANAIIIKPGDTACMQSQTSQPGNKPGHYGYTYADLAARTTGGQVGSICDNGNGSFAQMLNNITGAIVNQPLSKIISLNYIPQTQPKLTFEPASGERPWTWTIGSNQIVFSERPPTGTTVTIEIDYDPNKQKLVAPTVSSKAFSFGFSGPDAEEPENHFID